MRYKITAGPPEEWFPLFLKRNGECLLFTGAIDHDGYGQLPPKIVRGPWGSTRKAHRLAFALTHGYLPGRGREICHTCDRPACCEPSHLYDGTRQQNANDMAKRGRSIKGRKLKSMNFGETNHSAKLRASDVRSIRIMREEGMELQAIADVFNVSAPNVSLIVHRKTWRHIA